MGDLLKSTVQWLGAMRTSHASSSVAYRRGEVEATVNATWASTTCEVEDDFGLRVQAMVTDFLILAEDLLPLFGAPEPGDRIAADGKLYEVLSLGGQGHWRWSGPHNVSMRIHAKEVGSA
ncbi:MAG: hypothetical protein BWX88_05182 [Planctomycetes bacterium ADurb.Bin126]|nr:MAG: hypothetical protein BWX88_05182 [Planctomycetes bacterium ADurb.Bin126]HOD84963.1 hypothetical protein [Phycisphaerae bacterium]